MPQERDDFEGIDISGPWGGVRIGGGRARGLEEFDSDGDAEYRRIRRRVRRRLDFYRHAVLFAFIVGGLALIDWMTGGGWWVPWLAVVWGAMLALQFFSTFISHNLWGREVEERMVRNEIARQRRAPIPDREDAPGGPPA